MNEERELHSLSDLEERLGEETFPFGAVVPDPLNEWLTMYSASRGSTRELLLVSALMHMSSACPRGRTPGQPGGL